MFLPLYSFDIRTGAWRHRSFVPPRIPFGLAGKLTAEPPRRYREERPDLVRLFEEYLAEAHRLAESSEARWSEKDLKTTEEDLIPFVYV